MPRETFVYARGIEDICLLCLRFARAMNGQWTNVTVAATRLSRQACRDVFEGLLHCDEILSKGRFLLGERFTEADLRLIPTAVRFDAVYATLFKCATK